MNEKIMVVDDDQDIREVIQVLLSSEGYNPVFDSCTYKNPLKILINSAFFEGLFALKM